MKAIVAQAADTQASIEDHGPRIETPCETVAAAKNLARHYITDDFTRAAEMSTAFGYARVLVNGECVFDVFRRAAPRPRGVGARS